MSNLIYVLALLSSSSVLDHAFLRMHIQTISRAARVCRKNRSGMAPRETNKAFDARI